MDIGWSDKQPRKLHLGRLLGGGDVYTLKDEVRDSSSDCETRWSEQHR